MVLNDTVLDLENNSLDGFSANYPKLNNLNHPLAIAAASALRQAHMSDIFLPGCQTSVPVHERGPMIVDAHTSVWESSRQIGGSHDPLVKPSRPGLPAPAEPSTPNLIRELQRAGMTQHWAACEHADKTIVIGFKSRYLNAEVPNRYVAEYVSRYPTKLIGFAGIDPADPEAALRDLDTACNELGMKGAAIAPAAQDFHPAASKARVIYQRIEELQLPLLVHQGIVTVPQSKLEFARPLLFDEVARDFPDLRIVIAQLGFPWIDETLVLLGKHQHVYADISNLLTHPWRAYNALLDAYQYGVIDKLLFASGFPAASAFQCIEGLYSLNQLCQGTDLPTIPRELLRGIVERPTLELLRVDDHRPSHNPARHAPVLDDD